MQEIPAVLPVVPHSSITGKRWLLIELELCSHLMSSAGLISVDFCFWNTVIIQESVLVLSIMVHLSDYVERETYSAKECRRRKKEYIKCLESRVAVLEVQNKKLIEELETLKDICSSKTD
uniref:BZIP domain-containing protein n=1 Tax=Nothoprocta perdicaria TaxID=30464 RepID=A0A8C6Z150_NOTPE